MTLEGGRRARKIAERRRISVVGVIGEVFITAAVIVFAFLGWQVWLNNLIVGGEQQDAAQELSQSWGKSDSGLPTAAPAAVDPGPPVISPVAGYAEKFAVMIIPRLGADYARPVAEGVTVGDVLNPIGIGHYPGTQMPGEVGNAAFAAHRTGYGEPFIHLETLEVGDSIYVETEAGWYRYVYRSLEYVLPTGVGVINPVPQVTGFAPTDRIITLTSCNPLYTADERIIAYGVYDTWYPRAGGPPPEIAGIVATGAAG